MKHIGNLSYAEGSTKKKKRIGRGPGSGHGGTSTKGHKGAQSRSGFHQNRGFEGGQMPLNRRVPKFGFSNRFRKEYEILNVGRLQELIDNNVIQDKNITFENLVELGVLASANKELKVLGNGELKAAINIKAHSFSATAVKKIETAGGVVSKYE
jgi:large subunit ribosomal protein L15